jgi:hypothetical protein
MSTIKLKRSAVPGRVPVTANLDLGEIGINTYDGKMFTKKSVGGVESIVEFHGTNTAEVAFTTTATNQVADTFLATTYRTAKYLVQMSTSTGIHATEVLLIQNGTTVYMTEYGTIFSGSSLGTIDADISGGFVRLLVSPANVNTTVKLQRLSVAV